MYWVWKSWVVKFLPPSHCSAGLAYLPRYLSRFPWHARKSSLPPLQLSLSTIRGFHITHQSRCALSLWPFYSVALDNKRRTKGSSDASPSIFDALSTKNSSVVEWYTSCTTAQPRQESQGVRTGPGKTYQDGFIVSVVDRQTQNHINIMSLTTNGAIFQPVSYLLANKRQ
jgi:hypothetical protein